MASNMTINSLIKDFEHLKEAEELLKTIYFSCYDGNKLDKFFKEKALYGTSVAIF